MHSSEDKENVLPSKKGKRQEREKFTAAIADQEYDAMPGESREVDYRSKGWLFDLLEQGNKEATDLVAWRLEGTVDLPRFYHGCLFIQFLVCR
jgi:hypothetical protein